MFSPFESSADPGQKLIAGLRQQRLRTDLCCHSHSTRHFFRDPSDQGGAFRVFAGVKRLQQKICLFSGTDDN